ncbi:hypothetical protein Dcae01_00370 [Deinococcus caeni]|uniref:Uncharacterized protein n=2 Tax=Deinococcus caeni TaxID=569127 RepID=A0ABP9U969_9DEIO
MIKNALRSIRFSFFIAPDSFYISERRSVFQMLTSEQPDERTENPKTQSIIEQGTLEGLTLTVSSDSGRFDINLEHENPIIAQISSIDQAVQIGNRIISSIKGFIDNVTVIRYAIVFGFYDEITSKQEGYQALTELLGVNLDINTASDFMMRVNYPHIINGFKSNVVSTWSIGALTTLSFASNNPEILSQNSTKYFRNLEVDINTIPQDISVKTFDHIFSLIEQYCQIAFSVSERGPNGHIKA